MKYIDNNEKNNKRKEAKALYIDTLKALDYLDKICGYQNPWSLSSDGIEDDDTINSDYMRFWSGDD